MAQSTDYRVTLRPLPNGPPPPIRLWRFLKAALRGYGLRCVSVEEVPSTHGKAPARAQGEGEPARP
jgi:hypothetical protein